MGFLDRIRELCQEKKGYGMGTRHIVNREGDRTLFIFAELSHFRAHIMELCQRVEESDIQEIRWWNGPVSTAGFLGENVVMYDLDEILGGQAKRSEEWKLDKSRFCAEVMSFRDITKEQYLKEYLKKYELL